MVKKLFFSRFLDPKKLTEKLQKNKTKLHQKNKKSKEKRENEKALIQDLNKKSRFFISQGS